MKQPFYGPSASDSHVLPRVGGSSPVFKEITRIVDEIRPLHIDLRKGGLRGVVGVISPVRQPAIRKTERNGGATSDLSVSYPHWNVDGKLYSSSSLSYTSFSGHVFHLGVMLVKSRSHAFSPTESRVREPCALRYQIDERRCRRGRAGRGEEGGERGEAILNWCNRLIASVIMRVHVLMVPTSSIGHLWRTCLLRCVSTPCFGSSDY
jgi:hypothetical protein